MAQKKSPPPAHIRVTSPAKLPIGVSDFAKLVCEGYVFVDKTLMIGEIVQSGAKVAEIARPRRFGKTLNLSMLQYFFASEVARRPTAGLFDTLAIARHSEVMAHQGRYPVIFFTFKDVRGDSFEAFENILRGKLATLFKGYPELEDSPQVAAGDQAIIKALSSETASLTKMEDAFRLLSEALYKHYGQKVIILLDECDTPVHAAYNHGYYERLINFVRPLLSAALKDNIYLHKAILTGILRVSKENMFSGLNNTDVHTVLEDEYSRYFGFTEPEVLGLIEAAGLATEDPALEGKIKDWYNGYRFGTHTIYNPWSIINCLKRRGEFQTYWAHTSGDDLLKKIDGTRGCGFQKGAGEVDRRSIHQQAHQSQSRLRKSRREQHRTLEPAAL